MTVTVRSHIAGEWVDGEGEEFEVSNPARCDEVVARGRTCSADELTRAVDAAAAAARSWAHTPAHERAGYLARAASRLEADADGLGRELSREEGKTLVEGRGEVLRAAQILRFFAADADREAGEIYNSPRRGERILVSRRPVGVVAAITPFNFPIAIPAWKIAPALAYGNVVLFKPASAVPLLAMRFVEALVDAGLPAGVLQLVLGDSEIGSGLVEHPGVHAVTFTGSTGVGRRLGARCAELGKAFQGEMGGKNAAIVLADADLDLAVDQVVSGAFRSSGQKCTATSRVIVEEAVADAFIERLAERTAKLVVGDPLSTDTFLGPVIDTRSHRTLLAAIERARAAGVREVFGRPAYAHGELAEGCFVSPTIFEVDADSDRDLWERELFGPVLVVRRARSREDAVALANDSEFGLSGAVFTRDIASVSEILDDWNVGILHVNSETPGADPHVPFGGVKGSGIGPKEQGRAAREFFTESTTVYLRG
ncbi:aldehyde dehydrogenase family protein [Microbacterium terricola]|uniref:Aldehyde dehydrogenase n=1 Tax=Microbacterium terricola TaxID=344163 RepID=A0ABM8E3F2_9MICO|nr:aldehyde dehydrogenase family protein [Microbacterium terricola]UYK40062.1 aldehyde dehydrogenase family protein [Microbacterium terricola]BDV32241.1 aldehyde dehydrogenase [Microbacterium terricola]